LLNNCEQHRALAAVALQVLQTQNADSEPRAQAVLVADLKDRALVYCSP
jgi:hypothetical protein